VTTSDSTEVGGNGNTNANEGDKESGDGTHEPSASVKAIVPRLQLINLLVELVKPPP